MLCLSFRLDAAGVRDVLLRFSNSPSQKEYRLRKNSGDYVKSAYLRKQDAPPLGINSRGKVSPIRPEFIVYFTDIRNDRPVGQENRLMAAEWKAFFPHTIRRGTVMCDGCHDNPRRFHHGAEGGPDLPVAEPTG